MAKKTLNHFKLHIFFTFFIENAWIFNFSAYICIVKFMRILT